LANGHIYRSRARSRSSGQRRATTCACWRVFNWPWRVWSAPTCGG